MDTKPPPGSPHTSKPLSRTLLQVGVLVICALLLWLVGLEPFRSEAPQPQTPMTGRAATTVNLTPTAAASVPPSPTLVATLVSLSNHSVLTPAMQLETGALADSPVAEPPGESRDLSSEPALGTALPAPLEASPTMPEGTSEPEDLSFPPESCTDGASGAASVCAEDDASQGDRVHAPGEFGGGALPGTLPETGSLDVSVGGTVGEVTPFDSPLGQPQVEGLFVGRRPSIVTPFDSPLAQPSGETQVAATPATEGDWVWPVRGVISQGYSSAHRAIDIDAGHGSVVRAVDVGRVVYAKWERSGYGYLVIVDHGNGHVSYYAHLYGFYVDVGQTVTRSQQIGELGNTGDSTGPHLHFEIRYDGVQRNPLDLLPES